MFAKRKEKCPKKRLGRSYHYDFDRPKHFRKWALPLYKRCIVQFETLKTSYHPLLLKRANLSYTQSPTEHRAEAQRESHGGYQGSDDPYEEVHDQSPSLQKAIREYFPCLVN